MFSPEGRSTRDAFSVATDSRTVLIAEFRLGKPWRSSSWSSTGYARIVDRPGNRAPEPNPTASEWIRWNGFHIHAPAPHPSIPLVLHPGLLTEHGRGGVAGQHTVEANDRYLLETGFVFVQTFGLLLLTQIQGAVRSRIIPVFGRTRFYTYLSSSGPE